MAMFNVILHKDAIKFLDGLDKEARERIKKKLRILENEPYPTGCIKVVGTQSTFRIRIGDFRALYYVDYATSTIIVDKIDYRGNIYKRL